MITGASEEDRDLLFFIPVLLAERLKSYITRRDTGQINGWIDRWGSCGKCLPNYRCLIAMADVD